MNVKRAIALSRSRGKAISIAIVTLGVATIFYVEHRSAAHPSTDDATIDADVVHVASAVGGRIVDLPVTENAKVVKGDILFRLDPEPFELAVAQAEADLAVALGALDTRRRAIETEKANAAVAAEQSRRAQTNLELATRTVDRLRHLVDKAFIPAQQYDQARTTQADAATSLRQARETERAAAQAIGLDAAAAAAVRAREAALALTRRALSNTTIYATHDGRIVGLSVASGEMALPSQALFTLIDTEEWFAVANFRETDLQNLAIGDCATVFSMIDRRQPIKGVVESVGWGVMDAERINLPRSAPFVQRSLNWVRVAQRFPVRIRLENPPEPVMRLGASAVVEIKHGAACS
jgi:membrane fusion protein, multidrug efflux system